MECIAEAVFIKLPSTHGETDEVTASTHAAHGIVHATLSTTENREQIVLNRTRICSPGLIRNVLFRWTRFENKLRSFGFIFC